MPPGSVPSGRPVSAFDALFEAVPIGVARLDRQGIILDVNPNYLRISNTEKSLVVGTCLPDMTSLRNAGIADELRRALAQAAPALLRGIRVKPMRRSEEIVVDFTLVPLSDPQGEVKESLLIIQETPGHPRPRAGEDPSNLRPLYICDAEGKILDVNEPFSVAYGYTREEIVGQRVESLLSPRTSPGQVEQMWRDALDPGVGRWSGTLVVRTKGGAEHVVLLSVVATAEPDGRVQRVEVSSGDFSGDGTGVHIEADENRLASLGTLASGAAHELNTPLANMVLIAESLQRKSEDPWVRNRAQAIVEQATFAAKVVRNLLAFASRNPVQLVEADLRETVAHGLEAQGVPTRPGVTVRLGRPSGPVPVRADRGQLREVLFNLLENALDASPAGGTVEVDVKIEGSWALLTVSDHGAGIPIEVLPSLFQPFFTTKPVGQGQGLGLATCYGIIRAHGGSISVQSAAGEGATFQVRLPLRAHLAPAASASRDRAMGGAPEGDGRDSPGVRPPEVPASRGSHGRPSANRPHESPSRHAKTWRACPLRLPSWTNMGANSIVTSGRGMTGRQPFTDTPHRWGESSNFLPKIAEGDIPPRTG